MGRRYDVKISRDMKLLRIKWRVYAILTTCDLYNLLLLGIIKLINTRPVKELIYIMHLAHLAAWDTINTISYQMHDKQKLRCTIVTFVDYKLTVNLFSPNPISTLT